MRRPHDAGKLRAPAAWISPDGAGRAVIAEFKAATRRLVEEVPKFPRGMSAAEWPGLK